MECKVTGFAPLYVPPGSPQIIFTLENEDYEKFMKLQGKDISEYRLKFWRPRSKSRSANAYFWVLCDKIGQELRITKYDVYHAAVKQVGVFNTMWMTKTALTSFADNWCKDHEGRSVVPIRYADQVKDMVEIAVYYGLSDYDQYELSRLIDYVIDEAKALGIDTMTPNEIEELKLLIGSA